MKHDPHLPPAKGGVYLPNFQPQNKYITTHSLLNIIHGHGGDTRHPRHCPSIHYQPNSRVQARETRQWRCTLSRRSPRIPQRSARKRTPFIDHSSSNFGRRAPNFRLSLKDIVRGALRAPHSPVNSIEEPSDGEGVNDPFELARYSPYLSCSRPLGTIHIECPSWTMAMVGGILCCIACYNNSTLDPTADAISGGHGGRFECRSWFPTSSQEALPTTMDGATDNATLPESENVPPRRRREERMSGTLGTNAGKANRHDSGKNLLETLIGLNL